MWTEGMRLTPSVLRSNLQTGSPYKLLLAITRRCQMQCRHCRIWETHGELTPAEWSPDEVRLLLDANPTIRWLDVTGGEPTAHSRFSDVARVIAEQGTRLVFVHFPTNGFLPDQVIEAARILTSGNPRVVVTVSLDGTPPLHDELRGVPGSASNAIETYRRLLELPKVHSYIGTTVVPENAHRLPQILRSLQREIPGFRPDSWHINFMNHSSHYFGNLQRPSLEPDDISAALEFLGQTRGLPRGAFQVAEWLFLKGLRRHFETGTSGVPCAALKASLFVDADKTVYPCHIWDAPMGSLEHHGYSLRSILNTPLARSLLVDANRCHGCWTPCEAYHALLAHPLKGCFNLVPRSRGPLKP